MQLPEYAVIRLSRFTKPRFLGYINRKTDRLRSMVIGYFGCFCRCAKSIWILGYIIWDLSAQPFWPAFWSWWKMAFLVTEKVCRICQASCAFRRTKSILPTASRRGDFIAVSQSERISGKSWNFGCINLSTEEPKNWKILNRKTEIVKLRNRRIELYDN